jgi:hypothetical protein
MYDHTDQIVQNGNTSTAFSGCESSRSRTMALTIAFMAAFLLLYRGDMQPMGKVCQDGAINE